MRSEALVDENGEAHHQQADDTYGAKRNEDQSERKLFTLEDRFKCRNVACAVRIVAVGSCCYGYVLIYAIVDSKIRKALVKALHLYYSN